MILTDRFLIWFGVVCVIACTALQFERHALWFQVSNPYPAVVVRGR